MPNEMHVCGNYWVHVCGNAWVQSMRLLGACMRKRLGAKYADVGCKSMERLGACLTVGSLGPGAPGALDQGSQGPQGPWTMGPGAPGPLDPKIMKICCL